MRGRVSQVRLSKYVSAQLLGPNTQIRALVPTTCVVVDCAQREDELCQRPSVLVGVSLLTYLEQVGQGDPLNELQFWRTRCPACVLEVPALDKLAPQLEGPKFRLIAIALKEDSLSDIERFYARYQIRNLEILHDRDHLAFSQIAPAHPYYGVRSTPTTVLVDPQGNYISAYSGVPGWEKPEGVQLLKWIIDNA